MTSSAAGLGCGVVPPFHQLPGCRKAKSLSLGPCILLKGGLRECCVTCVYMLLTIWCQRPCQYCCTCVCMLLLMGVNDFDILLHAKAALHRIEIGSDGIRNVVQLFQVVSDWFRIV